MWQTNTVFLNLQYQYKNIPVVPGRAGVGSFRGENPISQRKNLPRECAQGHQPVRCPNRVSCVHRPSAVPSGGGVLVVAGGVSM